MAAVKLVLKVRTVGKKAGDVIEVDDQKTADALVANGSAVPVKATSKSAKD